MSDRIAASATLPPSAALTIEQVSSVRHWNEHLFSFSITRPPSFRFRSGEFVMISLPGVLSRACVMRVLRSITFPMIA